MNIVPIDSKLAQRVRIELASHGIRDTYPLESLPADLCTVLQHMPAIDRRGRPRLRVFTSGEVEYAFCLNGWLLFDDVETAYRYFNNRLRP